MTLGTSCHVAPNDGLLLSSLDASPAQRIAVIGGGLAAIFTAYELLRTAKDAHKKLDVVIIADKFNAPCMAGSHVVLELEGLLDKPHTRQNEIKKLLRDGLSALEETIARENIECRFSKGYEIKGKTEEDLNRLIDLLVANKVYDRQDFQKNSRNPSFHLKDHFASAHLDTIGQINVPELLVALINKIENMGGQFLWGVQYEGQKRNADGDYAIKTDKGDLQTTCKPFIATGAEHQRSLPEFPFQTSVSYTMGLVFGPLEKEDAMHVSKRPMAFCDTNLEGDVLWGGMDSQNVLTIGRGDIAYPHHKDRLLKEMMTETDYLYPGLPDKYPPHVSFGAMLTAKNRLPIVGRLEHYDIAGGWAGMGIVAGYAAAQAYAQWIIHGQSADIELFESMQPDGFSEASKQSKIQSNPLNPSFTFP